MNKLVLAQFARIEKAMARLEEGVRLAQEAAQHQEEEREKLLQQFWSRGKELKTVQRSLNDYEAVCEENDRLKECHRALGEHLRRVRDYTKALTESMRHD